MIGGEESEVVSEECASLAEEAPYIGDLDVDALNEVKQGNGSVYTGTYDLHLTITDGKSVNSTWDGAWGGGTVAQGKGEGEPVSSKQGDEQVANQAAASAKASWPSVSMSSHNISSSTATSTSSTVMSSNGLDSDATSMTFPESTMVGPGCSRHGR